MSAEHKNINFQINFENASSEMLEYLSPFIKAATDQSSELESIKKQNAALFEAASKAVRVYEHGERIDMLDAMMKLRAAIEIETKENK